jgi:FixJ family two-component response regulator
MSTTPTVFVVDDEPAVRDSLRALLDTYGFAVETYGSGAEFLDRVDRDRPGCLVADVRMPDMSGIELQRELSSRKIPLPVIVITGHGDVPMAVDALKTGAVDFFEKPLNDEALVESIRRALDRDQKTRVQDEELSVLTSRRARLTGREAEVMDLIVDGFANNVVAGRLGISARTVEHYRANIMQKMEASSFAHLVRMAIKLGRHDA